MLIPSLLRATLTAPLSKSRQISRLPRPNRMWANLISALLTTPVTPPQSDDLVPPLYLYIEVVCGSWVITFSLNSLSHFLLPWLIVTSKYCIWNMGIHYDPRVHFSTSAGAFKWRASQKSTMIDVFRVVLQYYLSIQCVLHLELLQRVATALHQFFSSILPFVMRPKRTPNASNPRHCLPTPFQFWYFHQINSNNEVVKNPKESLTHSRRYLKKLNQQDLHKFYLAFYPLPLNPRAKLSP